jgi:hypothetical protein
MHSDVALGLASQRIGCAIVNGYGTVYGLVLTHADETISPHSGHVHIAVQAYALVSFTLFFFVACTSNCLLHILPYPLGGDALGSLKRKTQRSIPKQLYQTK